MFVFIFIMTLYMQFVKILLALSNWLRFLPLRLAMHWVTSLVQECAKWGQNQSLRELCRYDDCFPVIAFWVAKPLLDFGSTWALWPFFTGIS
jgi:hypothetical protein